MLKMASLWTAHTQSTWRPGGQSRGGDGRAQTSNHALATKLRSEYRELTRRRGTDVRIEHVHVKSHTGVRGNEAADKLAALGARIEDGHRMMERYSLEPPLQLKEHKDNVAERPLAPVGVG